MQQELNAQESNAVQAVNECKSNNSLSTVFSQFLKRGQETEKAPEKGSVKRKFEEFEFWYILNRGCGWNRHVFNEEN